MNWGDKYTQISALVKLFAKILQDFRYFSG